MKQCKLIGLLLILSCIIACGKKSFSEDNLKGHPAYDLLNGERKQAKERYGSMTENTYYTSYSVYSDLSKEQREQIADYIVTELTDTSGGITGLQVERLSIAFYKEDSDSLIDEFMFKDGKRQEPKEEDQFISGKQFDASIWKARG